MASFASLMGFGGRVSAQAVRVASAAEKAVRSWVQGVIGSVKTFRRAEPAESPMRWERFLNVEDQQRAREVVYGIRDRFIAEDATSFVWFAGWMFSPHSSNVEAMQYEVAEKRLTVAYNGGNRNGTVGYYQYEDVSEDEAEAAFAAASKGIWVWDNLRVRGTRCEHHKDYVFLAAVSSWHPKNPCGSFSSSVLGATRPRRNR